MPREPLVTYRHVNGGEQRFRAYKRDPLPPWAVDVQDEPIIPTPEEKLRDALAEWDRLAVRIPEISFAKQLSLRGKAIEAIIDAARGILS